MRSPLSRPERGLAVLGGAVLLAGCASAVILTGAEDGDPGSAAAGPSASSSPTPAASPARPRPSASSAPATPTASASPPTTPPDVAATAGPSAAAPVEQPPERVAQTFFDAAVQGRDADALAVAEAQALSDLREYEAWQEHRLSGCTPEKGHVVCVFETASTFLRLVLIQDDATGWRVLSIE